MQVRESLHDRLISICRFVLIALAAVLIVACSQEQPPATVAASSEMPASELMDRMLGDKAPMVLDVRTPEEFTESHLPGAVNIAHTEFIDNPDEVMPLLPESRDTEIVVHCVTGKRAGIATDILIAAGYTNVRILEGNFRGWHGAGYPIISSE